MLLALLFYGYATGVFSSRKIEKATYEALPFRFVAGGLHPDHDTLANFRKTFLAEIKELFVQVLLLAQAAGYLKLGNISMDGSKVHANASKSKAVSYKRLLELETQLRAEVDQLFVLAEQADGHELPDGMNVADEMALRQERLERLAEAKKVLQARAQERQAAFFHPDRDLAGLGLAQLAGGADDVADVEQLGQRPLAGQHALAQAHLNCAAPIAQGQEDQLADVPQQNDSARGPGPLTLIPVLIPGLHRSGRLDVLVPATVGVKPQGLDLRQLLLPLLLESIRIGWVGQVRTPK